MIWDLGQVLLIPSGNEKDLSQVDEVRVVDLIHALQPPKRGAEFAGNLNESIAWPDPVLNGSLGSFGNQKKLSRIDSVRIREVVGKLKRGDGAAHSVCYDKESVAILHPVTHRAVVGHQKRAGGGRSCFKSCHNRFSLTLRKMKLESGRQNLRSLPDIYPDVRIIVSKNIFRESLDLSEMA